MSLARLYQAVTGFSITFSASGWAIQDEAVAPTDARIIVELRADGEVWAVRLNAADSQLGTWVNGLGWDPNDYDFQWARIGNDPNWPGGDPSPHIWINGGSTISWGLEELGTGARIASGNMLIRPAGGGPQLATAGISLNCDTIA